MGFERGNRAADLRLFRICKTDFLMMRLIYTTQNLIRVKLLSFVCRRSCISDTKNVMIDMTSTTITLQT